MTQKRLQVFISSTYRDLKEERQAAVEAILAAGHIPAGMELFAAGNKSQLETIRKWIEESDVFMVIVGTRYGDEEPVSERSYVELEYDHAEELGKDLFAVVLDDSWRDAKVRSQSEAAIDDSKKAAAFRNRVLNKISGLCNNVGELKYHVARSLKKIESETMSPGWVSGAAYRKLELEMESFRGMANQVAKAQSTGATGHTDANVDRICKALHESRIVGTSALERLNVFGARLAIGVSQIDQDYAELRRDLAPILALHELHYWSTAEIASQNGANKMTFHYLGLNALGRAVARRATSYLAEVAAP